MLDVRYDKPLTGLGAYEDAARFMQGYAQTLTCESARV
jgi:hypothetical protein